MTGYTKVVTGIIAALGILGAAYFGYLGVKHETEQSRLELMYEKQKRLEEQVKECGIDRVQFMIELSKKYESSQTIKDFVKAVEFPVWIKKVSYDDIGLEEFRMWYINPAYEDSLGITNDRYFGLTDYEVGRWDEETADQFYRNDSLVFAMKDYACVPEEFTLIQGLADSRVEGHVCKWAFRLDGGWAIAGMFINKDL